MPPVLASVEIVVGTLLAIAILMLALTYLRRRYISRGLTLTLSGYRPAPSDRWRVGLLRFSDNVLEWYTLGGVSPRPAHQWRRQTLLLETPIRLAADDVLTVLPQASRVPCTHDGVDFELALQRSAYTALRSWQEAAPPGHNANVA
ncbi:MAG: DUF2550 domain-containing protein [Micrococcales bacterium]|nr:DUF2550 domain-containing protein [Micrococcales bacterium]